MEIGIDIEENVRFEKMPINHLKQIFTEAEIAYAKKYANYSVHLCANWCVKEAFVKASSQKNIPFLDVEVRHNENGKPYINITPKIREVIESLQCSQIKISVSHSKTFSTAICLII